MERGRHSPLVQERPPLAAPWLSVTPLVVTGVVLWPWPLVPALLAITAGLAMLVLALVNHYVIAAHD